jgi:hypothetical protein
MDEWFEKLPRKDKEPIPLYKLINRELFLRGRMCYGFESSFSHLINDKQSSGANWVIPTRYPPFVAKLP